jgi:hypothetical protein
MDGLANLHLRLNLWTQAAILEGLALGVLVCIAAFVGITEAFVNELNRNSYYYYYYYVPGDAIWMLVVSIITLLSTGYFLMTQSAAKLPSYVPVTTFFSMGIALSVLWFTCAVALAASSISSCVIYVNDTSGLCATGGLADTFAWLSFAGYLVFSLTMYAVGRKTGSWGLQQNGQMGAIPAKVTQPQPQSFPQQYAQQPYSQPQQPYPYPQQPYPQQPYPQQPYPQSFPASPTPQPQQLFSQQPFPASPVQSFPASPVPHGLPAYSLPVSPVPGTAKLPEHPGQPLSPPPQPVPQSLQFPCLTRPDIPQ